jgi:hypothetical protein
MNVNAGDLLEVTVDGDNIVGPVTLDQLRRGVAAGRVPPAARVRAAGTLGWSPLAVALDRESRSTPAHDAHGEVAPAERDLPDLFGSLDSAVTQFVDPALLNARRRVGSVLRGKWRLDSLLGVGGMAAVYAATHRNGTRGAIKVLHSELAINTQVRTRFMREGYAANAVGHDGAVKVIADRTVPADSCNTTTNRFLSPGRWACVGRLRRQRFLNVSAANPVPEGGR